MTATTSTKSCPLSLCVAPTACDPPKAGHGILSIVFDGRYKLARYYAPAAFNTPQTLEEILKNNDVQLFDLENDPNEMHNLALEPEKNRRRSCA